MSQKEIHYQRDLTLSFVLSCCLLQELTKEILEMFTARKMGKVFFANSGSEANDSQVPFLASSIGIFIMSVRCIF